MASTPSRKSMRAAAAHAAANADTVPAGPARPAPTATTNTESPARNLRPRTRAATAPPPATPKRGAKAATALTPSRAPATPKAKATPSKTAATPSKAATPTRRRVTKAPSTPTPARKRTALARSPTTKRTPAARRRGKAQPVEDDDGDSSSSSSGNESTSDFDEAKASDHEDEDGGTGNEESLASESSDSSDPEPDDDDSDSARPRKRARAARTGPRTPRRRAGTATSRSTPSKRATPVHKKVARPIPEAAVPFLKRTLVERPTVKTYQQAKEVLHVSAVPEALPCREDEFATLYEMMESAIRDRTGRCLYVSGVPGTGKTATFFEVLRTVQRQVEAGDLLPFKFVEVNGMKVLDPGQAYSALWAGLAGEKVTIRHAQLLLSKYYAARGIYATLSSSSGASSKTDANNPDDEQEDADQAAAPADAAASSSASIMTPTDADPVLVLLLDELDLLVTKRQGVMYNLFEWAQAPRSRLIVVAIANTMDLPERLLTKRVASRLGMERIDFAPYTEQQLVEILRMRLGASCPVVNDNAITFAARKVSTVNGDARRLLDVTRRAVELAEVAGATKAPTKLKNSIPVPVDVAHIKSAADEMYASPAAQLLLALATSGAVVVQRVAVVVILAAQRRAGVRDVPVREVRDRVRETCALGSITPVPAEQDITRALVALAQAGILMLDPKMVLVQLNVSEQDVLNAFRKDEQVSKLVKL